MDNNEWVARRTAVVAMVLCLAVTPLTGFAGNEQQKPNAEETLPEGSENEEPLPVLRAEVEVFGKIAKTHAVTHLGDTMLHGGQAKDAGDLLRAALAVSSGRMGAHGLDPRIRGLGESSIRILIDGAEIHGGCPNRMDPPSSFAAVESYDEVVVVRGVQTLRYGTAPGTVLFERLPIRFSKTGGGGSRPTRSPVPTTTVRRSASALQSALRGFLSRSRVTDSKWTAISTARVTRLRRPLTAETARSPSGGRRTI
jgi:hypothetical protein